MTVSRKCTEPRPRLWTCKFPKVEQNVILQLDIKPTITATYYLTLAKEVLEQHTDLPTLDLTYAYLLKGNNLIFDTSLDTRGNDYEPYFLLLE